MNARGRRTQERADARRIANVRRELTEKARREKRRQQKAETGGG